jgi:hypothetical protein
MYLTLDGGEGKQAALLHLSGSATEIISPVLFQERE